VFCNRHAYLRVLDKDLRRARKSLRTSARPRRGRRLPVAVGGGRARSSASPGIHGRFSPPCNAQGRPHGPALPVRGRGLATDEEPTAEAALAARYGPGRAAFERTMDAMRVDMACLELTPREVPDDHMTG
jgi:hypothetical protein